MVKYYIDLLINLKCMNKYINKSMLLTFAAAITLMGAGCKGNTAVDTNSTTPSSAAQGKVIFSVTDAATNMNGVTSVQMTVDKIEMNSEAKGWVTVSNETKVYDLLVLKSKAALAVAAQVNVDEGVYNQVRLHIKKVAVVKSGVEAEAKLPSNSLKVNGKFTVKSGSTTSVKLDFVADESVHLTGSGKFIFAPVVKAESRTDADVSVGSDGVVIVNGGKVETNVTAGMDVDGEVRDGFKLDVDDKLEIDNEDHVKLMGTSSVKIKADVDTEVKADL